MKKIIESYIKFKSKFKPKNDFKFENANYNRLSLINKSLNNFDQKKCKYLEIGLGDCNNYNSVSLDIKNKYGVDPAFYSVNNIHGVKSDEFFNNNNVTFDVIFIDGLHHYDQVLKDLKNSLNSINKNGIILIHDMIPLNKISQEIPRKKQKIWTGDVWKLCYNLINSRNIEFIISNIDCGVGIVKPSDNFDLNTDFESNNSKSYEDFKILYNKLPIKSASESLKFIDK
jgi:hypothetical protein